MRKAYSYVRMSTKKQILGSSLKRQMDKSKEYAEGNNLELIEDFQDIGVSAYDGSNANSGALSIFLDLLENNKIENNSVLLVESLDRLSRANITKALTQFLNIINKGVEIVTLIDNQSYTKEKIDQNSTSLFLSLAIMMRANDESETKSKRIKKAWEFKRANSHLKVVTKLAPSWMKYSEEKNAFELITDRAEAIKIIFQLCTTTFGLYSITKYLNEQKVPVFGKSDFWNRSYVKKILTNRAVIGEYQPCKMENGKRMPSGEPVLNYYPKVIDEDLFYLAQASIDGRTSKHNGRKGNTNTNLFTGLMYCNNCGTKMSVKNRGELPKGGKRFICQSKIMGAGCTSQEWKLEDVEYSIFKHLREINFKELIRNDSDISLLEGKVSSLIELSKKLDSKADNILSTLSEDSLSSFAKNKLINSLNKIGAELDTIATDIETHKKQLFILQQESSYNSESVKDLLLAIDQGKEDFVFRSKLSQILIRFIERIDLIHVDNLFAPYELSEDDMEVIDFLKAHPLKRTLSFEQLICDGEFEKFIQRYLDRIKITYKSGIIRQIFYSMKLSIPTKTFDVIDGKLTSL